MFILLLLLLNHWFCWTSAVSGASWLPLVGQLVQCFARDRGWIRVGHVVVPNVSFDQKPLGSGGSVLLCLRGRVPLPSPVARRWHMCLVLRAGPAAPTPRGSACISPSRPATPSSGCLCNPSLSVLPRPRGTGLLLRLWVHWDAAPGWWPPTASLVALRPAAP